MRVAIIGAGVSGLLCAYWLHPDHEITLFEAESRLGGHINTVRVELDDETLEVDTGFIVYNDLNYPILSNLFRQLGVATQPTEMSFSVCTDDGRLEYRGDRRGIWAQPLNTLRPSFNRLLADIIRFNRAARSLVNTDVEPSFSLGDFLSSGHYGRELKRSYIVPLGSAIWSADPSEFTGMPAVIFARFLDNHGLLRLHDRPPWRTVSGGSSMYVKKLVEPFRDRVRTSVAVEKVVRGEGKVTLVSEAGPEDFEAVVIAVHSDEALAMLSDPSRAESEILGSIRFQPNVATLHTDESVLPSRRRAWASWNVRVPPDAGSLVEVTYWMNNLQRLDCSRNLLVSLNLEHRIDPERVLGQWVYSHPVYDSASTQARSRLSEIQGLRGTWFCGAYWGYGFHEDGATSAAAVCKDLAAGVRSWK